MPIATTPLKTPAEFSDLSPEELEKIAAAAGDAILSDGWRFFEKNPSPCPTSRAGSRPAPLKTKRTKKRRAPLPKSVAPPPSANPPSLPAVAKERTLPASEGLSLEHLATLTEVDSQRRVAAEQKGHAKEVAALQTLVTTVKEQRQKAIITEELEKKTHRLEKNRLKQEKNLLVSPPLPPVTEHAAVPSGLWKGAALALGLLLLAGLGLQVWKQKYLSGTPSKNAEDRAVK